MRRSGFIALLGAAAFPSAANAAAAVRIVALGDSLALGTGASRSDGGFIFPAFRRVLALRPGSSIDSYAIGGSTAADVLRLQAPRLVGAPADAIVICVGGNDVVRGTAPAAFAATLRALLAAVRRAQPRARIVCCGVPDVGVSPIFAGNRAAITELSKHDDAAARAAAALSGAAFVDLYTITHAQSATRGRFLSHDRFHPSDAGYALFAAALEPALLAAANASPERRPARG